MPLDLVSGLFMVAILILSVIIHEVAHGYAAYMLGDPTAKLAGRLTLNPLPHIDPVGSVLLPAFFVLSGSSILFGWAKPVPYNPHNLRNKRFGEAIVGVAGVATNLLLAVVFAIIARTAFAGGSEAFGSIASLVALTNLYLGVFNLIPFPPLDGFTVLRGLVPNRFAMAFRALEERLSANWTLTLVGFMFVFYYILAGPFYAFISWLSFLLLGR